MPIGDEGFLPLLDELGQATPSGTLLSVAAYPPPMRWHPLPDVHWKESYLRQIARRADQMVPMMYDTSIRFPKVYRHHPLFFARETLCLGGAQVAVDGVLSITEHGGYTLTTRRS